MSKGGGGPQLSWEGTIELAARPNSIRKNEACQATWDSSRRVAIISVYKGKHLAIVGHHEPSRLIEVGMESAERPQPSMSANVLVLYPEETLLLVEQGLLLLRLSQGSRILSILEVHQLTFGNSGMCRCFYSAYAHLRELGYAALRAEHLNYTPSSHGANRPLLQVWLPESAGKKGWRQTASHALVLVVHADDQVPSSEELQALTSMHESRCIRIAAVDDSLEVVFYSLAQPSPATQNIRNDNCASAE